MKITIAIPNYNGQDLLMKNLPNILLSGADEVLIIDDASTDKSIDLIKDKFPEINLETNRKNLGFIPTVNKLFEKSIGDVVVLLNNDVFVEKDFLKPLIPHFKDGKVFAVNCHEKGEGPSIAFWKNGFYEYKRGEEKNIVQKSAWGSGGSAAFSKKIWNELNGLDSIYAPFYYEDLDISFRAIKSGYKILWEPNSNVLHEHGTTISKTFSNKYKNWIIQRNLLLFIWKNIYDKGLRTDHRINLIKKLFNLSKLGYFIPFIWALWIFSSNKTKHLKSSLTDSEVINYAKY